MAYENNDKEYASKGVGTAGLTTGIIGTVLGSGILNNGLAGIFGGNQNPAASPVYQLSQKDNEIAQLKAQQYSDNKFFALSEKVASIDARVAVSRLQLPAAHWAIVDFDFCSAYSVCWLVFLGPLGTPLSERGALFFAPFGRPPYLRPLSAEAALFLAVFLHSRRLVCGRLEVASSRCPQLSLPLIPCMVVLELSSP